MGLTQVFGQLSRSLNSNQDHDNSNASKPNHLSNHTNDPHRPTDITNPKSMRDVGHKTNSSMSIEPVEPQGFPYTSAVTLDPCEQKPGPVRSGSSLSIARSLSNAFGSGNNSGSSNNNNTRILSSSFTNSSLYSSSNFFANLSRSNSNVTGSSLNNSFSNISSSNNSANRMLRASGARLVQISPFDDLNLIASAPGATSRISLNDSFIDDDNDSYEIATISSTNFAFDSDDGYSYTDTGARRTRRAQNGSHEEDLLPEVEYLYPNANAMNAVGDKPSASNQEVIFSMDNFGSAQTSQPSWTSHSPARSTSASSSSNAPKPLSFWAPLGHTRQHNSANDPTIQSNDAGESGTVTNALDPFNNSQSTNYKYQPYVHRYETSPIEEADEYEHDLDSDSTSSETTELRTKPSNSSFKIQNLSTKKSNSSFKTSSSPTKSPNTSTMRNNFSLVHLPREQPQKNASLTTYYISSDSTTSHNTKTLSAGMNNAGTIPLTTTVTPTFSPATATTIDFEHTSTHNDNNIYHTSNTDTISNKKDQRGMTRKPNSNHHRTTSQPDIPVTPGFSFSNGRNYVYENKPPTVKTQPNTENSRLSESSADSFSIVLPPLPPAPSSHNNAVPALTTLESFSQQMLPDPSQDHVAQYINPQYSNDQYAGSAVSLVDSNSDSLSMSVGPFATPTIPSLSNFGYTSGSSSGPLPLILNTQQPEHVENPFETSEDRPTHKLLPGIITSPISRDQPSTLLKNTDSKTDSVKYGSQATLSSPISIVSPVTPKKASSGTTSAPPMASLPALPKVSSSLSLTGARSTPAASVGHLPIETKGGDTNADDNTNGNFETIKQSVPKSGSNEAKAGTSKTYPETRAGDIDDNYGNFEGGLGQDDNSRFMELHESFHVANMENSSPKPDLYTKESNQVGSKHSLTEQHLDPAFDQPLADSSLTTPKELNKKGSQEALRYALGLRKKTAAEETMAISLNHKPIKKSDISGPLQLLPEHDVRYTPKTLESFAVLRSDSKKSLSRAHGSTTPSNPNYNSASSKPQSVSSPSRYLGIKYEPAQQSPKTLSRSSSSALALLKPYSNSVRSPKLRKQNSLILPPPGSKVGTLLPKRHKKARSKEEAEKWKLKRSKSYADLDRSNRIGGDYSTNQDESRFNPVTPVATNNLARSEPTTVATASTAGYTSFTATTSTTTPFTPYFTSPATPLAGATTSPEVQRTPPTTRSKTCPKSAPGSSNRFLLEATNRSYRQLFRRESAENRLGRNPNERGVVKSPQGLGITNLEALESPKIQPLENSKTYTPVTPKTRSPVTPKTRTPVTPKPVIIPITNSAVSHTQPESAIKKEGHKGFLGNLGRSASLKRTRSAKLTSSSTTKSKDPTVPVLSQNHSSFNTDSPKLPVDNAHPSSTSTDSKAAFNPKSAGKLKSRVLPDFSQPSNNLITPSLESQHSPSLPPSVCPTPDPDSSELEMFRHSKNETDNGDVNKNKETSNGNKSGNKSHLHFPHVHAPQSLAPLANALSRSRSSTSKERPVIPKPESATPESDGSKDTIQPETKETPVTCGFEEEDMEFRRTHKHSHMFPHQKQLRKQLPLFNRLQSHSSDTPVLQYEGLTLFNSDLKNLLENGWLSDNDLAFAYEYVEKTMLSSGTDSQSSLLVTSNVDSLQDSKCASIVLIKPAIAYLLTHSSSPETLTEALPLLDQAQFIFLPVNDNPDNSSSGGTHWSLALVCVADKKILYYDTLYDNCITPAGLQTGRKIATILGSSFDMVAVSTPKQVNSSDCGVLVAEITALLVQRLLVMTGQHRQAENGGNGDATSSISSTSSRVAHDLNFSHKTYNHDTRNHFDNQINLGLENIYLLASAGRSFLLSEILSLIHQQLRIAAASLAAYHDPSGHSTTQAVAKEDLEKVHYLVPLIMNDDVLRRTELDK